MNNYTTTTGNMQLRLKGGYQFSSKPIYFKKQGKRSTKVTGKQNHGKKSCGSYSYKSRCMKSRTTASRSANTEKIKTAASNKGRMGSFSAIS